MADQSISFENDARQTGSFENRCAKDPDVENVTGFTGGSRTNSVRCSSH
ncbi:hypothetical protein M8494_02355 [Serratia ureilytica]